MSRDDDLLERATRALRATPPPDEGELARAKLRMLAGHQAATKKRSRTLRWVLPLAAVLAAGSALASVPHGMEKLAEAVNRIVGYEILAAAPKLANPSKVARKSATPEPTPVPGTEPSIAAATEAATDEVAATDAAANEPALAQPNAAQPPRAEPSAAESTRSSDESSAGAARAQAVKAKKRESALSIAPAPSPEPTPAVEPEPAPAEPEPTLIASADLAKYRAAHKAHFQQRDFALALRGWEQYLRQFPNGTFAIEARYNRAICLLRLGRNDEARRALTPFSKGEIGAGYRQAEATKLLEALE